MDKAYLEKLDNSDAARLKDFEKTDLDTKAPIEFLTSKIAKDILKSGSQALIGGFKDEILPSTVPFSDRVFVQVCPSCDCVKSPRLLLPYLERDLIVPVLIADYADFDPAFIEFISSYPYVSYTEFHGLRHTYLKRKSAINTVSKREIDSLLDSCINAMTKQAYAPVSTIAQIFENLSPYYRTDLEIMLDLLSSIKNRKLEHANSISALAQVITQLRYSQVFPLVPQVKVGAIDSLKTIPSEYRGISFQENDVRNAVLSGLKLTYNKSMDLATYLDVVSERKSIIRKLVRDIMKTANTNDETSLANLRTELEKINSEVRSLQASKKALTVEVVTNFLYQNKTSIVAGLLTAASAGIAGLGIISCGAVGLISSASSKAVSKISNFSVPEQAVKLQSAIATVSEPYYEAALARVLGTNKQAVQLWHIQRKLR
jgi:hypothetical protein